MRAARSWFGVATCVLLMSVPWVSPVLAVAVTTVLGTTGAGPTGIVLDSNGNVYTANSSANNVTKITPTGVSSVYASTGAGSSPRDIAIDGSGNIYTANYDSANVTKINTSGTPTLFANTGSTPNSIAIDSSGNVYVGSANENYISKFSPSGLTRTDINVFTFGIQAIAIDQSDNLYAANYQTNQVLMFNSSGTLVRTSTVGSGPTGIAIDSSGNVYVSNGSSNTVSKINPAGVVTTLGTTGNYPYDIGLDAEGNVYTSNFSGGTVTQITPTGISSVFGSAGLYPYQLVLDSAGNVYVTNGNGEDRVTKLSVTRPVVNATPVKLTFDSRGGSSIASTVTINGGSVTDPGAPTRDGYTFTGWNTVADGSGTAITFPYQHTNATDFTLYAQWRAISTTASTPTTMPPTTVATPPIPEVLPSTGNNIAPWPLVLIAAGLALITLRRQLPSR